MRNRVLWILLLALLLVLCACSRTVRTDAPLASFSFSHSGMHTGLIYTLSAAQMERGWQANISLLAGEQVHMLDMTEAEAEALAETVERHALNRWNGFDKTKRRVQDGTSFALEIGYADGQAVNASGNNAFPKGYDAAHAEIRGFFGSLMERNGLDNPF